MNCPKCQGNFSKVVFNNIEVERCETCNGLWFDMLEKEDLIAIRGSESIDIGNDQVGEKYSLMQDIACPVCDQKMIPMVDKDQFHIKYESCATCFGTFFDAGEFRDLKDRSVVERFMQLINTVRDNLD